MTFEIGQRVNVAPLNEEEEAHEIIGTIVRAKAPIYDVLLDKHLYGMDPECEPNIDVFEDDLTLIKG